MDAKYLRNRRRWSIPAALAVLVVFASGYFYALPAWRSQRTVAGIRARGGSIEFVHGNVVGLSEWELILRRTEIGQAWRETEFDTFIEMPGNCTREDLGTLQLFPRTQSLVIRSDLLDDEAVTQLPTLVNTRNVELDGAHFTSRAVEVVLNRMRNLEYLNLHGRSFDDGAVNVALRSPTIVALGLSRTSVSDVGARKLLVQGSVSHVDLAKTAVSDRCLDGLSRDAVKPVAVDFSDTQLSDQAIATLLDCPSIRYLTIAGMPLAERACREFERNTSLKQLDVSRCARDIKPVVAALAMHPSLESLVLNGNPLGVDDVEIFWQMPLLTHVYVTGCGINQAMVNEALDRCEKSSGTRLKKRLYFQDGDRKFGVY